MLNDSSLNHSYWAEAAAYSIDTRNLVPSRQHPGNIPTEAFTGRRQDISFRVFDARCWAKVPTTYGGSKLDPQSVECKFLGYASGSGNYKVQDITTHRVFILRDVFFEEGQPCRTSVSVGEETAEPVFDTNVQSTPTDTGPNVHHVPNQQTTTEPNIHRIPDQQSHVPVQPGQKSLNHVNQHDTSKPH